MGRKERGRGELCYTRIDILGYLTLLTNDREGRGEDGEEREGGGGTLLHKDCVTLLHKDYVTLLHKASSYKRQREGERGWEGN